MAWAPVDRGVDGFWTYVEAANKIAGQDTWGFVKGFRFLLQGIKNQASFDRLVFGESFVGVLQLLGREGWSFDVGIDQRQGGVWQLEHFADALRRVHDGVETKEKTVIILSMCHKRKRLEHVRWLIAYVDHLCKPDMEQLPVTSEKKQEFERWKAAICRLAQQEKVYMKLSGGFSEIAEQDPVNPWPIPKLVKRLRPWMDHLFACFPPHRLMFGSDWPVCNVRGPGDALAWTHWRQVMEMILNERNMSKEEQDKIWLGTAVEAYKLDG